MTNLMPIITAIILTPICTYPFYYLITKLTENQNRIDTWDAENALYKKAIAADDLDTANIHWNNMGKIHFKGSMYVHLGSK
jgi:hypothetical protein